MNKPYTTAAATDIARAWREKYAYVPASELPEIIAKHTMFKRHGYDITKVDHEQTQSV